MLGVKKWIFFSNNLHETELFSSQRREMLFVLGHQHGSRDVTFKPAIFINTKHFEYPLAQS